MIKISGISIADFVNDDWCGTGPKKLHIPKGVGTTEPGFCGTGPKPFPVGGGIVVGGSGEPEPCGNAPRPIGVGGSGGSDEPEFCGTGPRPFPPKGGTIFADKMLNSSFRTFDANILTAKLNMR